MKKSKFLRLVAVLMTVALLLGMLPATALAGGGNELPIQTVLGFSTTPTTITAQNVPAGFQWHFVGETEWYTSLVRSGLYPNTEYKIEYISTANSTPTTKNVTTAASQNHTDRTLIDTSVTDALAYTSYKHSFELNNDLTLRYYLKASKYDDYEYTNLRIYVEKQTFEANSSTYTWTSKVYTSIGKIDDNGTERYAFSIPGISADEVCNQVCVTLYADKDGKTYITPMEVISLRDIAVQNFGSNATMNTLIADFLNYCASSQKYFHTNEDNYANTNLGSYATYMNNATTGTPTLETCNGTTVLREDETANVKSYSLDLASIISLRVNVEFFSTSINKSKVSLHVDYIPTGKTDKTTKIYRLADGDSLFIIKDIPAIDFGCPMEFTIYEGTTPISSTKKNSFENRARSMISSNSTNTLLVNLLYDMVKYSRSAKAYFSN